MKKYRLGILGAGNMGMAIAEGAVQASFFSASEIALFNRTEEKRTKNAQKGFAVCADMTELYACCDMLLLGIKPQNFDDVLPILRKTETAEKPLIISIAAGVTFSKMEKLLGEDTAIIRVLPNTPLMLGYGATQLAKNEKADDDSLSFVCKLFDTMGITTVFTDEKMLNEAIPYAGSAPAYIYTFADAMIKSAEKHGISQDDALEMFCQTMIGSAKMLLKKDKTPEELISAVCSPGGTTIEAMKVLENHHFYDIISEASDNCIKRAYELGE